MSARNETLLLKSTIKDRTDVSLTFEDANALRKAQKTLHRWAELECGDGDNYVSWAIERDEGTGKPFLVTHRHEGIQWRVEWHSQTGNYRMDLVRWFATEEDARNYAGNALCNKGRNGVRVVGGMSRWTAIPDRETGAIKRVAAVCQANGLHFYHQTDPRGYALYVAREPLTESNYSSRGVACV